MVVHVGHPSCPEHLSASCHSLFPCTYALPPSAVPCDSTTTPGLAAEVHSFHKDWPWPPQTANIFLTCNKTAVLLNPGIGFGSREGAGERVQNHLFWFQRLQQQILNQCDAFMVLPYSFVRQRCLGQVKMHGRYMTYSLFRDGWSIAYNVYYRTSRIGCTSRE